MFSLQLVQATLDKYGLHLDAKQVLRKISGKRPGKHCVGKSGKGSYISAEKKCADHRNSAGKLTEAGKASARELSAKVRQRKGMNAIGSVAKVKDEPQVDISKPLDKAELKSLYFRVADGEISAKELKDHWQRMKLSGTKDLLRAELGKQTIAELQKEFPSYHKMKKGEMVEMGINRLEDMFVPKGESTAYMIFGGKEEREASRMAAMDKAISTWTDEKIQAQSAERKAQKTERVKALTNPETLDEFRSFSMVRGESKLTPEQRRKYEDLQAEENLRRRTRQEEFKATAAPVSVKKEGEVFGEIQAVKHTRTGQDLHVVPMGAGDRLSKDDFSKLKDRAKTFGGYYSSFRGAGAVPGFQFRTPEDAAKFRTLDEEKRGPERAEESRAKTQSKLTDLADRLEADATKTLSADRQVNTARRARMAGNVESAAQGTLRKAETIRNLADADSRGELKFLGKISSGTDIDQLDKLLNRGHYNRAHEVQKTNPGRRMEELYDEPRTVDSIDYAKMPSVEVHPAKVRNLARVAGQMPGMKRLSDKYMKASLEADAKSEKERSYSGVKFRSPREIAEFKDYVKKIESKAAKNPRLKKDLRYDIDGAKEVLRDVDRLQRLGITNDATLRAALREYLPHTGKKKVETPAQSAYRKERELIGGDKSIGVDFFPTPNALAEQVATQADIREGMSVLDPSAGGGRLSDAARELGGKVKAIEMSSNLNAILKDKGYDVEQGDFLKVEPTESYDRVVMNPPFSGGADMEHVQHAYKFLKPGGKMVAIMSEGPFFRGDKKAEQFRSWLGDVSGDSEKLPENSFKESNTGVNTRLVTIEKPGVKMDDRSDFRRIQAVQRTLEKYGLSDRFDAKQVLRKIGGRRPGKRCKGGWIAADKQCSDHKTADGKLTAAGKASARELAGRVRDRKGMLDRNSVMRKRLVGLDDRIEASQKAGTARKTAATKARKQASGRAEGPRVLESVKPGTLVKNAGFVAYGRDLAVVKNEDLTKEWQDSALTRHLLDRDRSFNKAVSRDQKRVLDQFASPEYRQTLWGEISRRGLESEADNYQIVALKDTGKQQIAPSQLNAGDRKQAVTYNEQGAKRAKSEGRSADVPAWQREAKQARISNVKSAQRQVNTTQSELFGIEEVTDLPLFRKRKDSDRWNAAVDRIEAKYGIHFDRAIAGGKTKTKSTRKKHNCSPKSQQCGTVCIPLTKECRDGSVGSAQERLKKLKRSGADDLQVQRAKTSIKARTTGKRSELAEKRIGVLRDRVKNSALSGARKAEGLAELDPNTIEVDPKRFQYKIIGEHTATGSVGSLAGVRKYDPNLAGILQVWKDPADGKTYVVNGHNRLDLGKKLGAESVAVRYLKAPDAKTARAIGALTNIAEGRGDALDAAKFFRDTGISKEDLSAKGIPMREKIATDGLALSKLDDSLFRRTIDGDIPMARAAIVGGSGLDAASQRDLMKLVDKEGKKKNLTDGAISEMVDIAKSSQTSQEMTLSLFGEEMVTKSNMIEKAKLQASIKQRLSREKNLFGTVSRGRAADELARGGNTIDKSKSGEISSNADRTLKQFDQMKNLSGPMSDAINRAATRMSNGESQKSVEKDLYAEISTIDIFGNRQRRAA